MSVLVVSTTPASAVPDVPWDGRTCELAVVPTEPVTNVRVKGPALPEERNYPGLKVAEPVAFKNVSAAEKKRVISGRTTKAAANYSTNLITATAGFLFPCDHSIDYTGVGWTEQDGRDVWIELGSREGKRHKDSYGNYVYITGQASQPWTGETCEIAVTATAPISGVFVESDVFMHPGMRVDVPLATYAGPADTKAWKLLNRRHQSREEFTADLAVGQSASWLNPCVMDSGPTPTLIVWRDAVGERHLFYPSEPGGPPSTVDAAGNRVYRIG